MKFPQATYFGRVRQKLLWGRTSSPVLCASGGPTSFSRHCERKEWAERGNRYSERKTYFSAFQERNPFHAPKVCQLDSSDSSRLAWSCMLPQSLILSPCKVFVLPQNTQRVPKCVKDTTASAILFAFGVSLLYLYPASDALCWHGMTLSEEQDRFARKPARRPNFYVMSHGRTFLQYAFRTLSPSLRRNQTRFWYKYGLDNKICK